MSLVLKSNVAYKGSLSDLPIIGDMYQVTNAVTMVGTRLLNGTYKGALLRVRRKVDNAEKDIGYTANGGLDTASLMSFIGSGDGAVAVMYDQSGNGNNIRRAYAEGQPEIVIAGVLQVDDKGQACLRYRLPDKAMFLANPPSTVQSYMGAYIEGKFDVYGFAVIHPENSDKSFFALKAENGVTKLHYRNSLTDTLRVMEFDASMVSESQKYFASIDSVKGEAVIKDKMQTKTQKLVNYEKLTRIREVIVGNSQPLANTGSMIGYMTAFVYVDTPTDGEALKDTI